MSISQNDLQAQNQSSTCWMKLSKLAGWQNGFMEYDLNIVTRSYFKQRRLTRFRDDHWWDRWYRRLERASGHSLPGTRADRTPQGYWYVIHKSSNQEENTSCNCRRNYYWTGFRRILWQSITHRGYTQVFIQFRRKQTLPELTAQIRRYTESSAKINSSRVLTFGGPFNHRLSLRRTQNVWQTTLWTQ